MTRGAQLAAFALVAALGCASSLDLARVKDAIEPLGPEAGPALSDSPNVALAKVEGVRAMSGELNAIPLRWDASREAEVAGYVVDRAPNADGPFALIARLSDRFRTVYVDSGRDLAPKRIAGKASGGLAHAETYYYRVRAFDGGGRIAAAEPSIVSGTTAAKPAPPSGVQAYSHLPRRIALRWQPASDPKVTGYVVSRSPSPSGTYAIVANIEGRHQTVFLDERLPDLGVFYYRVASLDATGAAGDPSGAERAVTKGEPLPPTGLRVASQSIGSNELRWEANVEPDLRGYRLLRRRADEAEIEIVAQLAANTTRANDSAVVPGERTTYRVVAIDADGLLSSASDPLEISALDYGLRAHAAGDGVRLGWDASAQAGFLETRVLLAAAIGSGNEIGRSASAEFLHREGKRGARYQLIGVRKDGSEAPASKVVEAE